MPDFTCFHLAAPVALALALAGCSEGTPQYAPPPVSDNAEFVELVQDARGAMIDGNLADAGRLLDQAIEIEPENPALWVDIARLRFRGGEHTQALEAADRALELGPEYGPALLLRAQLVRDAHGLADALSWFEAAVQADPANPEVLAEYAATLGDLGRNQDMLKVVRELHKVSEGYPQVFYLQAVLAARAGDPVLARSLLAKSGLFQRGVPAALLLDAVIDIQQQSPDTAVTTLEQLAQRQPANIRVRELLARALWQGGRDGELIDRFGESASAVDASPYLTMLVGRAYERMGDRERAASLIEQALAAREVQLVVLGNASGLPDPAARMRSLVAGGNAAAANAEAAALLRSFPGSADIKALAGDAALAGGNATAALTHYRDAASVRRPWPLARKIIAATRAFGDDSAADAMLVRAVLGEPRNAEALLMLAQRRGQLGDWKRAALFTDLVVALGAGNDPKVLDLRAAAAEALGKGDEATRWDAASEEVRPSRLLR